MNKYKKDIGDRVSRELFMDDGTWIKRGDTCLKESPLRFGNVLYRSSRRNDEIFVQWDDGGDGYYLDHGVDFVE